MKICFFTGSMQLGGIGKLTLNLIREFVKKDIEVDLFLLKGDGEYLNQLPEEVQIFIAEGKSQYQIYSFIKYLIKQKPDISISARQRQDIVNIFCCLCSFGQTEPVVSIHTNLNEELKYINKERSTFPFLAKFFYKVPSKYIAVSSGVANDFSKRTGVLRENIQVIHNPIYISNNAKNVSSSLAYQKLRKNNDKYLVSAGRFTEAKDFFTLIKAFNLVRQEIDIPLVLLGDGPLRQEIEAFIHKLSLEKSILMTGYVSNPEYYIREASVFVLSSKWEGFGNVLVEAMGVGTPVVSTDCPSGPAEILEYGKYGKLVPVGAPDKMANAIISTLKDPISSEILKQRSKDFTVPKIAEEYLEYLSLPTT